MHLFLLCPYIIEVWKECTNIFGIQCHWKGLSILQAWENWRRSVSLETMTSLPLLVIWGVWIARNNLIFSEKCCTLEITTTLASGILTAYAQHIRVKNQRDILEVEIDKSFPWAFFNGAAQENICGGGAILFLREGHLYKIMMGLGEGSNNYVELFSLKLLLIFAAEKGCRSFNVFGDSMNVINWIKKTQVTGKYSLFYFRHFRYL